VSKNLKILLVVALALTVAAPAMAAKFAFHGDMDNRFNLYTNQIGWFGGDSGSQVLDDDGRNDTFGEIKYRLWTEMATDDGSIKGVYGIEVGGVKFGQSGGGSFSGDGVNLETRWAYTDFQLPGVDSKARFQIGLFTNTVNKWFWSETAMGVKFYTDNWYLAWLRGGQNFTGSGEDWGDGDIDSLNARYDLKVEPVKVGFFLSYLWSKTSDDFADYAGFNPFAKAPGWEVKVLPAGDWNILALGIDGGWSTATNFGKAFINWDGIYEFGSLDNFSEDGGVTTEDIDQKGYLLHADLGLNFGKATVTYTVLYASGHDLSSSSNDIDAFISVDVDANYSIIFNEGVYTNDTYFSERPYVGISGMFLNKLALDYAATKKTKLGIAGLYLMTAEDLEWTDGASDFSESALGIEIDAYVTHKLYDNLELALNFGYLVSGDAMDFFETSATQDGSADVNIWTSTAHVRYSF